MADTEKKLHEQQVVSVLGDTEHPSSEGKASEQQEAEVGRFRAAPIIGDVATEMKGREGRRRA